MKEMTDSNNQIQQTATYSRRMNYCELFNPKQLTLYTLYCEEGMSAAEIASLFCCSIDDVVREIQRLANIVAQTAQAMM